MRHLRSKSSSQDVQRIACGTARLRLVGIASPQSKQSLRPGRAGF
jgi:hypothetical protein